MSHIHNLTSHLKNTTITPAPTPQLTYQLAQNGLKIYQANQMQHPHQPPPTRMVRPPIPPTINHTHAHHHHRPTNTLQTPGRKGVNYPHRIISANNAITLTPTTMNHFPNSAHHIQFQQHSQLQQQLRKPTILTHPQQRGPTPPTSQQFVNNTPAHQFHHQQQKQGGGVRFANNSVISHQNHMYHQQASAYHIQQNSHNGQYTHNSPTKVAAAPSYNNVSASPSIGLTNNNNATSVPTTVIKQIKRNSSSSQLQPKISSGGAARVQHVLNQNRKSSGGISINSISSPALVEPVVTIKKESCVAVSPAVNKSQPSKKQMGKMPTPVIVKTEDDAPNTNITTEHVLRGPRPFRKGDDVLLTTDDGTFMFGTVGMVHGVTLQIMFGDGTQQLASFNKVKLLSCSVEEEDEESSSCNNATADLSNASDITAPTTTTASLSSKNISKSNKVVGNSLPLTTTTLANEEVTCGSCGVVKRVAGKKALNYAPHTKTQFNCRRCVNKSRFGNKGSNMQPSPTTPNRGKATSTSSNSPNSTKSPNSNNRRRVTSDDNNSRANVCFHCEKKTNNNDRLHCNLCERACHLSCLAMTPTPLEGDRFWDVICSACGTQNGDSSSTARTKVFSCRRSITSWSDVAHLILSCLASDPENTTGERFFDLEKDIIPFIMTHTDRLHLPRTYKNIQPESRKEFLSTALHNATLRFLNGSEVHRRESLWAIRENNNHQGYPLRVMARTPQKNNKLKIVPNHKSPTTTTSTTPNGGTTRLMRTPPTNKWTAGIEGGSSRSRGTPPKLADVDDPPELDKYDAPFISGSSPSNNKRMSQTERLVQKAKKTCLKTKDGGGSDTNLKRKASDTASASGGSPESKRLKLSPENGKNGITPPKKIPSPIHNKQIAQWLDCLNSNGIRKSPLSNIGSPSLSESAASLFGKAVKSAGITPPGTYASSSPEKPSLRVRKPKALVFKGKNEKNNNNNNKINNNKVNGMVPPKLLAKLKGRLNKQSTKSNAATARFSQIPSSNGASQIPEDQLSTSDTTHQTEFCFLNSRVEELIEYGLGYRIHCLPEHPIKTEKELQTVKQKVAAAYANEMPSAPPAYLSLTRSSVGATTTKSNQRKQKSKKDLRNVRSYDITGIRIDASGKTHYQVEWKDGYGNDSDDPEYENDEDNKPIFDWNDPEIIIDAADKLEVPMNGHYHPHIEDLSTTTKQEDEDIKCPGNDVKYMSKACQEPRIKDEKVAENQINNKIVEQPVQLPIPPRHHLGKNLRESKSEGENIVIDLTCDD